MDTRVDGGPAVAEGIETVLAGSLLFGGVPRERLALFIRISERRRVEKGAAIFQELDPATHVYVLGAGRVALTMTLERPDGSVVPPTVVASVGPGEAFGWSAVVEPNRFTLSARAVESCDLVRIEGRALMETLDAHRDVGYLVMVNMVNLLASRLAETREAFVFERGWVWAGKYPG